MKVQRTISIDEGDLKTLKPFLDSNNSNLSQAIRQLINDYRQMTSLGGKTADQQKVMMLRNQIIENRIGALIPVPLVKWLVKRSHGVPPLGTFRIIMEKYTKLLGISSLTLSDYVNMINIHGDVFGYQIKQQIEVGNDSKSMRISFEADDPDNLRGAVPHYSCMLAHHPLKLKTKKVIESPSLIIVDYEQCNSEEDAYRSVIDHFGHTGQVFDEILRDIPFWNNTVSIMKADHYEDTILSRSILLRIFKSCEFSAHLNDLITSIYGVSIDDVDYRQILRYIGNICRTNGLIERIDCDNGKIRIYHTFDDRDIIRIINDSIIKTLEMSGQNFVFKKKDKLTILNRSDL